MSDRLLPNWLSSWMRFNDRSEPPELFKKWCGISTIAACLQRKCFLEWETEVYPNFYIVLVGPSGCRKGTAMGPSLYMLQKVGVKLAAEAITREALIRELSESVISATDPDTNMPLLSCSLTVFSLEFAVFLGYENKQLMSDLTDLYDCRDPWTYRTKTAGTDTIHGTFLNICGATTPELIQTALPRDAVGAGLTSRMIFVYGAQKSKLDPYPIPTEEERVLKVKLLSDLEAILMMSGRFALTQPYIDKYIDWYIDHSNNPVMDDPNFYPYLERRPTHLRKLSMIMSASRGSDLIIDTCDFDDSLKLLEETEKLMPRVFGGYGRIEIASMFPRICAAVKIKKKIDFDSLYSIFYKDLTIEELSTALTSLKKTGIITLEQVEENGKRVTWIRYKERAK